MLVDADAYFRAARDAMRAARHSIFILSWDIDSRMCLVPAGANDGYPERLGDFLMALLDERPALQVWLLNWDYAMLYTLQREWLSAMRLGWIQRRHLHFAIDNAHPVGASHHQKILVVDDAIAFVGGLDLTGARWDRSAHAEDDPLRVDRDGRPYGPFHDVQAVVDGEVAAELGSLCRERWRRATGHLPACARHGDDCWPWWLVPDISDVDVAISRTEPAYGGRAGVQEIQALHLDAIKSARESLLFENQYFTSGLIANALAGRLAEADGPEVLMISPRRQSGWLEEATMGVLRARLVARLRKADGRRRFRLCYPALSGQGTALNVHSKVFFADDRLCSIGSANLSSRSMACDTECNLSVEARGPHAQRIAMAITGMRARLLAEHLGCPVDRVLAAIRDHHSVSRAIDALSRPPRTLRDFEPMPAPELDALIPEQALFDPEQPIDPERLVAQSLPSGSHAAVSSRIVALSLLLLVLAGLALAWHSTPLNQAMNLPALIAFAQQLRDMPFTPLLVVAAYVLGCVLMMPVMLLIAATGLVFGLMPGALYALAGTLCAAAAGYGIGAVLGRDLVRRMLGSRLHQLSRRVARRGLVAMIVIRMLPVAPFGVVNLVCGASHLRFRDYLLGTVIGMTPGILLTTAFAHNLALAIRQPSPQTLGILLIVLLLLVGVAIAVRRLSRKRSASP
jgi:phosphatidylserine/phosphatidylglycerophosphate/cardiolipin synthase-like enzyme/uncharacterized membrane protein YdjX (TVP38/TMEM64 family)